jgi:hypothetical protein
MIAGMKRLLLSAMSFRSARTMTPTTVANAIAKMNFMDGGWAIDFPI